MRRATRRAIPAVLFTEPKGTLLPLGGIEAGHKGYALALLVEAATGALAGHGRADPNEGWGATVFVQVLDPAAFGGVEDFERQIDWRRRRVPQARRRVPAATRCACPASAGCEAIASSKRQGVELFEGIMASLAPWAAKLASPFRRKCDEDVVDCTADGGERRARCRLDHGMPGAAVDVADAGRRPAGGMERHRAHCVFRLRGEARQLDDRVDTAVAISVFDGPPSEMADLVPDNPNARIVQWTFKKPRTRDIYIVCNYADTRIGLARKAPPEVASCSLSVTSPGVICK